MKEFQKRADIEWISFEKGIHDITVIRGNMEDILCDIALMVGYPDIVEQFKQIREACWKQGNF
jgi:hypothetical protein